MYASFGRILSTHRMAARLRSTTTQIFSRKANGRVHSSFGQLGYFSRLTVAIISGGSGFQAGIQSSYHGRLLGFICYGKESNYVTA